jgi:uncharacterized membrane protein YciS (DUF1049 family)
MKKITILYLVLCLFSTSIYAQDGYTYTLVDDGSYNFSIQAVPNTSASNFNTLVQSYGFTILLPDGVTATLTSSLGNAASATLFDGNDVGVPTNDGYLITETLGSPLQLPPPANATNTTVVTLHVEGNPTSGEIRLLANNSTLATTVTPLKSFMQADMIDNGMAEFTNVVDPNASGLSGLEAINFSTLSIDEIENTENISLILFPNPAVNQVNIQTDYVLNLVELYDITGKLINTFYTKTLDISHLNTGVYFLKIQLENITITKRLVKE